MKVYVLSDSGVKWGDLDVLSDTGVNWSELGGYGYIK